MLSRRAFILSAAAVGGSLVAGLRLAKLGDSSRVGDALEIGNWVTIGPDSRTVIRIARMEMGQGVMTSMAQLLAEELGVDWAKVRTEYISMQAQLAGGGIYGKTTTSSSSSVRRSQELLRICGAQIRTMLVRAAAERLGVPAAELVAQNSTVTHRPSSRSLSFGELASAAAEQPVPDPDSMTLKRPDEWTLIGKSVPRVDMPSIVCGAALYGIDVRRPGMKHAAVAMNPVFGEKLNSYGEEQALSRPGVRKVIPLHTGGVTSAVAVVADQWWQAKGAVDAMDKDWSSGSWRATDSAAILAAMRQGLDGPVDKILRQDGSVEASFAAAAQVVEAEYAVPYLEHATMEPMNCTALVTDKAFEIWAPTQAPENAMAVAAEVAGLPIGQGNLHLTQIGGGFGRRLESDFVAQAVEIAKAMKGTPVKLLWSREDTTRHGFYRPANLSRLRGAIGADGALLGWMHRIVAPSASLTLDWLGAAQLPYAIPNILVDFVEKRGHIPEGLMRSVGLSAQGFFLQSFMDELARAAGADCYSFQQALLDPERANVAVSNPRKISPRESVARLRAVLDEAARRSNWSSPLARNRGRGLAALMYANTFFCAVVEVTLDTKGWLSVDRVVVVADPGFLVNPDTAAAQVEGSVAFGLSSALYGEITIDRGGVVQGNFNDYRILRMDEMPEVETHWVLSKREPWGGLGEPVVAAMAPALVNAIYDAGGPRIRSLPLKNHKLLLRDQPGRGPVPQP